MANKKVETRQQEREVFGRGLDALRGFSWKDLCLLFGETRIGLRRRSAFHGGMPLNRPGPVHLMHLANLCADMSEVLWEVSQEARNLAMEVVPLGGQLNNEEERRLMRRPSTIPWLAKVYKNKEGGSAS